MTREGGSILHLLSDYQMDKGSLQSLFRSEYFMKKLFVPLCRIVWSGTGKPIYHVPLL